VRTKTKFEVGDLVKLKSGGPLMTVLGYEESIYEHGKPDKGRYRCAWFDGKGLNHGAVFPARAIAKETPPQPGDEPEPH